MAELTPAERAVIESFGLSTYCIDIPDFSVREPLVAKGLIEWVPAPAWSGHHTYALTEAGRAARDG